MKDYSAIKKVFAAIVPILYIVLQIALFKYLDIAGYNMLMLSATILTFMAFLETVLLFLDDKRLFNGNANMYQKLEFYWNKKQYWMICHWLWLTVYYFISGMAVLSSCIIIYVVSQIDDSTNAVIFYSVIALSLTFINLLAKPFDGSKAYRNAYIRMEKDILNCMNDKMDILELPAEFEACEREITSGLY